MSSNWLWHNEAWQEEQGLNLADRALHYGDGLFETPAQGTASTVFLCGVFTQSVLREGLDALFSPAPPLNALVALAVLPKRQSAVAANSLSVVAWPSVAMSFPKRRKPLLLASLCSPSLCLRALSQGFQADISPAFANQPMACGH